MSQVLVRNFFNLILFLGISMIGRSGHAVFNKGLKSIPIQLGFETIVDSPHHLTLCNGLLWTFSESNQTLVVLDPKTGAIKQALGMPPNPTAEKFYDVTALTCQYDRLYMLVNAKKGGRILEFQAQPSTFKLNTQFALPYASRATDLFCNNSQCWLIQDKSLVTNDFKKWRSYWVPFPQELKKAYGRPDLDPFEDWQRSLNIAKGKYTKGAIDSNNQYVLLDPFQAQAVIRSGAEYVKWGSFGAWEGSFLSPKSVTFVRENTLAVADSKLKAVFLFRRDGVYLGILAWGPNLIFTPDYPLGMTSDGNRLFVADFRAHKIYGVDLKEYKSNLEDVSPLTIRQNLFRREEVLNDSPSSLCLNCHDGTVSSHLHKFVKQTYTHPYECSHCHDPHHVVKSRSYLREKPEKLCLDCHKDYVNAKTNHVGIMNQKDPHKKGGSCTDCHQSHAMTEKLLVAPKQVLCLSCHKEKTFSHKSVEDISILEKSKDVVTDKGNINCQTCHQTHINWRESRFVKPTQPLMVFCSSCHGDKTPKLFKDFHKSVKLKKVSK